MSPLLRRLALEAARRLAADPRVRQAAIDAAVRAKPHVEAMARNIGTIARETRPLDDPAGFVRRIRSEILRRR